MADDAVVEMAEAVKNQADPTEPGQQVTALKGASNIQETLKALGFKVTDEDDDGAAFFEADCTKCGNTELVTNLDKSEDPVVDHLISLNKRLDAKWQAELAKNTPDDAGDDPEGTWQGK